MANYSIPPWLSPRTSPAEEYSRGLALGANIAQQRNQLAAQQEQAAIAAQVRQQEIERQALKDQQEIMITQAYQATQAGLKSRELDQAQQLLAMKTKQAANQFIAQEVFKRRVTAGEDPAKVLLEMGPALGESLTGAAQLYKATRPAPNTPPTMERVGDENFLKIPTGTGQRWQHVPRTGSADQLKDGSLESVMITDPETGKPLKGWRGVLNSSGGYTPLRIGMPEQAMAQKRMAAIEKGPFGQNILANREPADKKLHAEFKKAQEEYKRIKAVAEGDEDEAPASSTKIFNDGKRKWKYIGTSSNPIADKNPANWQEVK